MPDPSSDDRDDLANAVAAIRREFNEGLRERLGVLESSLGALGGGFDPAAAQALYYQSHSLKGTAGSFGAAELVEPAAALSAMGRSWLKAGAASPADLLRARGDLERLRAAVDAYLES
jgi:HPt (histidine-containing phosphotransfer) domain-containing protein